MWWVVGRLGLKPLNMATTTWWSLRMSWYGWWSDKTWHTIENNSQAANTRRWTDLVHNASERVNVTLRFRGRECIISVGNFEKLWRSPSHVAPDVGCPIEVGAHSQQPVVCYPSVSLAVDEYTVLGGYEKDSHGCQIFLTPVRSACTTPFEWTKLHGSTCVDAFQQWWHTILKTRSYISKLWWQSWAVVWYYYW